MGHYEGGHNGGKLPGRFRQAFLDAVEACVIWQSQPTSEPKVWLDPDDDEHGEITVSRACGLVWNCTDRLPLEVMARISWLVDDCGPLIGPTYACGARQLLPLIEWRRGLDRPPWRYEARRQPEAVKPPSSPLAKPEERIDGVAPPPILSDSDIEKLINDAIEQAFEESKKPTVPIEQISPEADKAFRELVKLFGSKADDELPKTPPEEQRK